MTPTYQGFIPMVCRVALSSPLSSPGSEPAHLTALRSLRSILQLGAALGQPPQEMDSVIGVLFTFSLGISGGPEEAQIACEALGHLGRCCRSATSARRLLEAALLYLDGSGAWSKSEGPVAHALAILRGALDAHGLAHLVCNALLRHVTRGGAADPTVLRLAVAEGAELDPLASASAVAQALRYFPSHLARPEHAAAAPKLLETVATLAGRVTEPEELMITLASAAEQVDPDSSPLTERTLQCIAAAAAPLFQALREQPVRARNLLRSTLLLHRLTALAGAQQATPAARALALELLLGFLRSAGACVGASHVRMILSGAWHMTAAALSAGDQHGLKAAEALVRFPRLPCSSRFPHPLPSTMPLSLIVHDVSAHRRRSPKWPRTPMRTPRPPCTSTASSLRSTRRAPPKRLRPWRAPRGPSPSGTASSSSSGWGPYCRRSGGTTAPPRNSLASHSPTTSTSDRRSRTHSLLASWHHSHGLYSYQILNSSSFALSLGAGPRPRMTFGFRSARRSMRPPSRKPSPPSRPPVSPPRPAPPCRTPSFPRPCWSSRRRPGERDESPRRPPRPQRQVRAHSPEPEPPNSSGSHNVPIRSRL